MRIVTLLLVFFSIQLNAQIQFWTKESILEQRWEKGRKAEKIKTAYIFTANEKGKIDDSTQYNEITHYNENGQKVYYTKYETNKRTKKRYKKFIDSFEYNEKGIFKEQRRYLRDGESYYLSYKAVATYNDKGYIDSITTYRGYRHMPTEKSEYDIYSYNSKNQIIKIETYDYVDGLTEERFFKYNKLGFLVESTATNFLSNPSYKTITKLDYAYDILPMRHTEMNASLKIEKETIYSWDSDNRLTSYNYKNINSPFTQHFTCFYTSTSNRVPNYIHLQSNSTSPEKGIKSVANEDLAYKFEYFK